MTSSDNPESLEVLLQLTDYVRICPYCGASWYPPREIINDNDDNFLKVNVDTIVCTFSDNKNHSIHSEAELVRLYHHRK